MSEHFVITIGREYGSGGHAIAEKLAEQLKIPYYDKNMIEMLSKDTGLSPDELSSNDEKSPSIFSPSYMPYGTDYSNMSEKLFILQSKLIHQKVKEGPCIIVGRCADYLLQDQPNVLNVFVYAPVEARIARIMEDESIESEKAADKILHKIDKYRKTYYQFYTDKKWGSYEGKDLVLNSKTFGIDGCAEIILQALKLKGYIS